MKKEIKADKTLVAYCGLYCGACGAFLRNRCKGCHDNVKATWCQIRSCCTDNSYLSCADCQRFTNINDCKKFNNLFSKIFAFLFRSNRKACIDQIRKIGLESHAKDMADKKRQSIKK